jgi:iron complex outermembrane receptor protein
VNNHFKLFLFGLLLIGLQNKNHAQSLQGFILEQESRVPLIGATIYIPDLKTGAVSDQDGKYYIGSLPRKKLMVQIRLIGYSTISQTIDLDSISKMDFFLALTTIEKKEIVVTGSAFTTDVNRTSVAVIPVDKMKILSTGSDNLAQSLSGIPGISIISTGNAISKPVIRGLGFNRVVVVNEGIRQEGQQWGDEHGLEIDKFSADRIEILKGPSSLLYGSDALGGVINILEPILPTPGKVNAELNSEYSSNNSLISNSLMTEGNVNGFTWRGRGTLKSASSYNTPVETVYNSAYEEKSAEVLVGLHKRWGYSHIHASRWNNQIGITEGERDSSSGKFLNQNGVIASDRELNTRKLSIPFQHVAHSKLSVVNNFILGKSQLRVNVGAQQNDREEFSVTSDSPELSLRLKTFSYDIKYYLPERNNFETAFGVSGMKQLNQNKGREFLIPDYDLNDFGIFSSIKKSYEKTTLNAGARYDLRDVHGEEKNTDSLILFRGFNRSFFSISVSVGVTHQLTNTINLKANIGRGFRAPNIPELSSNGVHEGTNRFEKGNTELKPETSLQFDLGLLYESDLIEASINLFQNNIDNFIYSRHVNSATVNIDGVDYPIFEYVQGQSTLKGGEFTLDVHPLKHLHFENSLSYVRGQNEALNTPLPFIPPLKIVNELRYDFSSKPNSRFHDSYIKVEVVSSLNQNRTDIFETSTRGFSILNIGLGTSIRTGKQTAIIFLTVSNISDTKYFDHLSRMKEINVLGTGRNLSFGLMLPIGLK